MNQIQDWIKEIHTENTDGQIPDSGLYEIPGFVDFHLHTGWTDFDHEDQKKRSEKEVCDRIDTCVKALSDMGFRLVRDAGGLESVPMEHLRLQQRTNRPLSLLPCCGMINGENAQDEAFHRKTKKHTAGWVKIFATGGVGAPKEKVLIPTMKKELFFHLVKEYHNEGKLVMVHTWGGDSLDWCIEAGVDSVEHGIYMNKRQAYGLAKKNILYIPTAAVYQLLAASASQNESPLKVPKILSERACLAVEAHRQAVKFSAEEGVRISCGTDFYSDPALLSYEYEELFALQAYGVPAQTAWQAFCGVSLTEKETNGYPHEKILLRTHPKDIHSSTQLKNALFHSHECLTRA